MTLSDGQCQSNCYKLVKFSHVYCHNKFEWNQVICIWMQTNHISKILSLKWVSGTPNLVEASTNQQIMAAHQISPKLTQMFVRKWLQKYFLSHTTMTLNVGKSHWEWFQSVEFSGVYKEINEMNIERTRLISDSNLPLKLMIFFNKISLQPSILIRSNTLSMRLSDQEVSTAYHIPTKLIWELWKNWHTSLCFLKPFWPKIKVKAT